MMSLEAATRGMGIKGSPAGFTVAAFSYKEMHYVDVLLLPFLKWSGGDQELVKSQKVFPSQQPELSWALGAKNLEIRVQ